MIKKLFCSPCLVLLMVGLAVPALSAENGEKVTRGAYFLNRAATPEQLIAGVSLPELSRARFEKLELVGIRLKGKFGRSFSLFRREDQQQVKITVAVYSSVAQAEDAALELLDDTSMILAPGSRSGEVIGTHSWYYDSPEGHGAVVFTYHNALFQIFSTDYNLAEVEAQRIVLDAMRGENGIRLGKKVPLPQITEVKFSQKARGEKQIFLTIRGEDPDQGELEFMATGTAGQVLETKRSNEKIYLPARADGGELLIYAVSSMNVVSDLLRYQIPARSDE